MRRSVLDDLGEEVTGIVSPVSICMALTVALVRVLNPEGESNSGAVFLASAYYTEDVRGGGTGCWVLPRRLHTANSAGRGCRRALLGCVPAQWSRRPAAAP